MTRPPAFRLPPVNPIPLFLFFGHDDYVIARDATEAAVFWRDHFNEVCWASEFEKIPEDEYIDIYADTDEGTLWVMTPEEIKSTLLGHPLAKPDTWSAQHLVERFPPGYLASTTED